MTTEVGGDFGDERLFNMIEAMIQSGAEVRIGKRRVHVQKKDTDGLAKITLNRSAWNDYVALGRRTPNIAMVKHGLR